MRDYIHVVGSVWECDCRTITFNTIVWFAIICHRLKIAHNILKLCVHSTVATHLQLCTPCLLLMLAPYTPWICEIILKLPILFEDYRDSSLFTCSPTSHCLRLLNQPSTLYYKHPSNLRNHLSIISLNDSLHNTKPYCVYLCLFVSIRNTICQRIYMCVIQHDLSMIWWLKYIKMSSENS